MIRSQLRRGFEDPRQLDFLSFTAASTAQAEQPRPPPNSTAPKDGEQSAKLPAKIVASELPFASAVASRPGNYRITDSDQLGEGSLREKAEGNLAAIELLARIETENRHATEAEKRILVKYVGWGGLPQVFDELNAVWAEARTQLRAALNDADYASARATTLNAHYTSRVVIEAIYSALSHLGFEGGQILEPACGLGHFIGLMPEAMRRQSRITGIEIDGITARIARALYPESDIRHQSFEQSNLPDGSFDLAISNVPFGDYRPFDPRFPSFLIHDYFFAAALAKVRPGGLIAFITSKGTFDKKDTSLREYLQAQADLVGAIRLPHTAFKRNANTEVTTDIVFLKKRGPSEPASGPAWAELHPITNSRGENLLINEYLATHPQMMLGEMQLVGTRYRKNEPTLVPAERDLAGHLSEAIQSLPQGVYQPKALPIPAEVLPTPAEIKLNAYCLCHGEIARREGDTITVLKGLASVTAQRIPGLIRVRDALRHCLETQWHDHSEEDQAQARARLNQAYDTFVTRFGPLSGRGNVSAFKGDPDLSLLLSIEHYDRESGTAAKAAIFRERTIAPRKIPQATDAASALLICLSERGQVDPEFLSKLLSEPPEKLFVQLRGLVFLDPETSRWETDDAYLSGDVRSKLQTAEAAARTDPRFQENVEALRAVQPEDLGVSEIDARLGSAWIPEDVLRNFAETLLGESGVEVRHLPVVGSWIVQADWNVRFSVANTTEWGTEHRSALDLLEDSLNLRVPTVYRPAERGEKPQVDGPATEAARDKQQKLKERFQSWVWEDEDRQNRLCRLYNDQYNRLRLRTFNGAHLSLPGASTVVALRGHQRAAVWRILQSPNTLLAHVVGAGKTFTMVAAAMELRRLGLARKPLFVVPNHMLEQFSRELLTLYPAAHLLVASKEDFERQRRQTLMSRIATGNWDAVIVTHSGFEKIPLTQDTQVQFLEEQVNELARAIAEQRDEKRGSRVIKELEKAKKRLETHLKELLAEDRKDEGLCFEQLGVDRLFVDEAHHFKNLFYVTKMTRIAGLPQTASQRALDMFLKVRHVQTSGGGTIFATGTPIANSVAEMFTMQRYLQLGTLRQLGVAHFDAWAGTFGEPVTAMELAPDGSGYRLNTRFARFINVPELMAQFRQVADVQTAGMLKLPVPELRGGRPAIIQAPCSEELKKIVEGLVARAERLKSGQVDPRDDNMLLITSDGRKAALDLRLVNPALPDHPNSKVNLAANQIFQLWQATASERSSQLVFCDLSTPAGGKLFSVYDDLRAKLLQMGVPSEEIAFIQEFESDEAKAALFRDVRQGRVRILLGSTAKMGSGTNLQSRLIALHHLDAPWRPADVEQREGRILRQGNQNPEVQIYRYVTASSFDAYMWQVLETKAKFIAQVMSGDTSLRRLKDVDGAALTYAEVKAIASGNPLVIEKANVDAELARMTRLKSQHQEAAQRIRFQARQLTEEIPRLERRVEALRQDLVAREDTRGERFRLRLGSQEITDRGIAGELLNRFGERLKQQQSERSVGQFAGFELLVAPSLVGQVQLVVRGSARHFVSFQATALGTTRSLEHTVQHLEEALSNTTEHLSASRKRLSDLREQQDQPFEYAEQLATLARRQGELEKELDLTKNQATGAVEEPGATTASETESD